MEGEVGRNIADHTCIEGMAEIMLCKNLSNVLATSYGCPTVVLSIMLREHLGSHSDADTTNTSHVGNLWQFNF